MMPAAAMTAAGRHEEILNFFRATPATRRRCPLLPFEALMAARRPRTPKLYAIAERRRRAMAAKRCRRAPLMQDKPPRSRRLTPRGARCTTILRRRPAADGILLRRPCRLTIPPCAHCHDVEFTLIMFPSPCQFYRTTTWTLGRRCHYRNDKGRLRHFRLSRC